MINSKNLTKIILLSILIFGYSSKVDASIPVTYKCCINYSYSAGVQEANFEYKSPFSGIQLDNFENISNWTVGGTGASQIADTVNFKEGSQGLKLIAKNGNRVYTDKIINKNFSSTNNFALWVYVEDINTFAYARLYFTSTNFTDKYFYKTKSSGYKNGWNRIVFDKRFFANVGGEDWNNTMKKVRIAVYPAAGMDTNATVDDLRYDVDNDWIGSSQEADTIHFKEGSQGLKLIAKNGTTAYSDFAINKDFSKINNFAMWVYVNNASNISSVSMYVTSNQFNSYFYDKVYDVRTGWNKIVFNKHSFKNNFNESWNNVMTSIRLRILSNDGQDTNVTFDDLRNNLTGQKAVLMIEFDDGYYDLFSNAYPILNANNQTGVSYVIIKNVGKSSTYMDTSDLRTLQSAGWDVSSHTYDHPDLTSLNDSSLTYELNSSYDWLVANKFQKSAGFIAYPYGYFNDAVLDKVEKRYVLGRAVALDSAQQHLIEDNAIRYIQRVISARNSSTVQELEDQINDTINAKLLGIMLFHHIVDNDNPQQYEYSKTDFKTLSDYIKSRSSNIDVITNSNYVIPNIKKFTPVINKTTRIYSNGSSVLITKNKYDEYMPNMTVRPLSDSINIGITTYNETGGLIKFNESSSNSNLQVSYNIGDRIPNYTYSVKIYWANGTKYQDFNVLANSTGYIKYNSTGFKSARYQEITVYAVPPDASSPVAYWKFDENMGTTAYDSSGNGNKGTIYGATWTAGKIGSALSFDGINDYVDAGGKASLNITNAITIEAWVNPNLIAGTSRVIARKSSVYYFQINSNGRLEVYFYGTTNPGYHRMTSTIPLNTWTYVAATYDGSKVFLYKNGTSESFNDTGSLVSNTYHVQIGSASGGSRQFSSLIDEVRIYNRALSTAEILADYNAG